MDFQEFTEKVKEEVGKRLEMQVQVKTVQRNNGVTLTGLVIMDSGSNTSPAIYLNSYYENGEKLEAETTVWREGDTASIEANQDGSYYFYVEGVNDNAGWLNTT